MKCSRNYYLEIAFILAASIFITSCWSAQPWPHQGITIQIDKTNSTKDEIVTAIKRIFVAHGFEYAGKAGYDAINKSRTVDDYKGKNGQSVSIYLAYNDKVQIGFDQNRSEFSEEAKKIFNEIFSTLQKKWPGAITKDSMGIPPT